MTGRSARRVRSAILFAVLLTALGAGGLIIYGAPVPPPDASRTDSGQHPVTRERPSDPIPRPNDAAVRPDDPAPSVGTEQLSPEPAGEDPADERADKPALDSTQQASEDHLRLELVADDDDVNVETIDETLRLEQTTGSRAPRAASAADSGSGVGRVRGSLLTDPIELAEPTERIAVDVRAEVPDGGKVFVDVRGLLASGQWTEWIPAPADDAASLDTAGNVIQVRVTLLAGGDTSPVVRSVLIRAKPAGRSQPDPRNSPSMPDPRSSSTPPPTPAATRSTEPTPSSTPSEEPTPSATSSAEPTPSSTPSAQPTPAATPSSEPKPAPAPHAPTVPEFRLDIGNAYRVFATREGLVGHITANGHVIAPRDHFVALPSRRSLAPRGTGDYTVKVCADNGRCEFAPVWDVGPWNTRDDYWNPPDVRESWPDLPQGVPEAQAAYLHGYNSGRDQFGRIVTNPAGIDLADGVFWDGLRLTDNAWVTVTYLWTGEGPFGTVRADLLHVRKAPTTKSRSVGYAAQHAQVPVQCALTGQQIRGPRGTTDQWLLVGPDQFVSAAFVTVPNGVPAC